MLRILLSVILKCSNLLKYSVLAPINDHLTKYWTNWFDERSANIGKKLATITMPRLNKEACIWLLANKPMDKLVRIKIKVVEIAMIK